MAKPTKADHPTLSILVWDDAWSNGNTVMTLEEVKQKHHPSIMQTLGWVLQSDDTGVSIANERCMDAGDECYRGHTFVPRSLIKSVTPFKLSTTRRSNARAARHPAPTHPVSSPSVEGGTPEVV